MSVPGRPLRIGLTGGVASGKSTVASALRAHGAAIVDADAVARVLGSGRAVLLRGHGAVVAGEDVETCFTTSMWLEENARKQVWASLLGPPPAFSEDMVRRVRKSLSQRSIIVKTWDYYVAKGKREGIL